jgi:hypothetical protein
MAYHTQPDYTMEKYSKSALLEQLLSVDYDTFKRNRPQRSRSKSNKKYSMLE